MKTEAIAYARVGLLGNPSDGFYGKTISACITNFWAKVSVMDDICFIIERNEKCDPLEFVDFKDLENSARRYGYYGGVRLIYAACKKFNEYCKDHDIRWDGRQAFRISYETNIPRQVGLGGSSAIVVALFKAIIRHMSFPSSDKCFPSKAMAHLALAVETEELGIRAGLQDRVVQTYGGFMYMDFGAKDVMHGTGYGMYERMPTSLLPTMFLAHVDYSYKNSGMMHNAIHERFERGDDQVVNFMKEFADTAGRGRFALEDHCTEEFESLMDHNYNLREELYRDAIFPRDKQMIEIAHEEGCAAKFPGSGGSVIGVYDDDIQFRTLKKEYERWGFRCVKIDFEVKRVGGKKSALPKKRGDER